MKGDTRRLLLVDEDLAWLRAARPVLSRAGYDVGAVHSLNNARQILEADSVDLVLVDLVSAEQVGDAFAQVAQIQASRGNRIVVLFGTELTPEKVAPLLSLGANDCLDKPYDLAELVAFVHHQVTVTSAAREERQTERQMQSDRSPKVLIVEDEPDWGRRLARYLEDDAQGYQIQIAPDYIVALQLVQEPDLRVVVLDLRLIEESEDFQGMGLLDMLRARCLAVAVVVVTAYGTLAHVKDGFQCYKISAFFAKQTFDPSQFKAAVRKAAHRECEER